MKKISVCLFVLFVIFNVTPIYSQKVAFISSSMIRDKMPDVKLAEQRCQTMIDEWKRELKSMEDKEESLKFDMQKNRLIWSDAERTKKDKELADLQTERLKYAKEKFSPNGESDQMVINVMRPVEEKIFAAVQEVASKEKIDFVWDQSTQPLSYVHFKYDLTLKVLKLLGVDVSLEEKEQQQKITSDPRNDEDKRNQSQQPRRRSRTDSQNQQQSRDLQRQDTDRQINRNP